MIAPRAFAAAVAVLILASTLQLAIPRATAAARTIVIEMRNPLQFFPDEVRVDPGDVVTFVVYNNDTMGHTFDLPAFSVQLGTVAAPMAPGTNRAAPAITASSQGTFWFFCAIPGHAQQQGNTYTGMAGRLVVGQATPPPDLTVPLIIVGVIAAAGVGVGLVLWARRRAPKS